MDSMNVSVLICDDAVFMRKLLTQVFTQAGYRVAGEAATGWEAVERFRALRPDLVTMDIVMPELGGIDAVREILAFEPDARIVMCSAMRQRSLMEEALEAGARDFIVKPFQPSRVLEAARRALG